MKVEEELMKMIIAQHGNAFFFQKFNMMKVKNSHFVPSHFLYNIK